jgi:hypothetical protein
VDWGKKKKTIFYEYNNYPLGCVFIRIFLKGLLGVFRIKNLVILLEGPEFETWISHFHIFRVCLVWKREIENEEKYRFWWMNLHLL